MGFEFSLFLTKRTVRPAVRVLAAPMRMSVRSAEVCFPLEFLCKDVVTSVGWGSRGLATTLSLLSAPGLAEVASLGGPRLLTIKRISAANFEFMEFELDSRRGESVEIIGSVPRLRIVDIDVSV